MDFPVSLSRAQSHAAGYSFVSGSKILLPSTILQQFGSLKKLCALRIEVDRHTRSNLTQSVEIVFTQQEHNMKIQGIRISLV